LAGCDAPQVKACEAELLDSLKSPSSYKRVSVLTYRVDDKDPKYLAVAIQYDAANSFNAMLRDSYRCEYRLDSKGRPTTESFDPYAGVADNVIADPDRAVEEALAAAANAVEDADAAFGNAAAAIEGTSHTSDPDEEYPIDVTNDLNANETARAVPET
jgi:hypothetical protein